MNILLINGGQKFRFADGSLAKGELSRTLHETARETLQALGHTVKESEPAQGIYDKQEEIGKLAWADATVWQIPVWWMGLPWKLKQYIDDVFTAGAGILFASDGRHRSDPDRNYGRGGLLQGRHYMISTTWNAPELAFTDPAECFEGRGTDGVFFNFHKANQHLGLSPLPSFAAYDVIKKPDMAKFLREYRQHLEQTFGKAA